ncbi:MAG TPA: ParA family protein [Planctomycetes bacterium]|nr:ParA family protein [Planctomycetota bacterium]
MQTLAFVNQKGGCGKTTAVVHLAGALALGGDRVLVVDLDPQAHATLALGQVVDGAPSIADVLLRGVDAAEALLLAPAGIALLPSSLALAEFEESAERVLHAEGFLARALANLHGWDFVLIDCPPRADGVLTLNALRAADTAVLVVETGTFALQGALKAAGLFTAALGEDTPRFELRVLATLFDRRLRIARDLLTGVQARFGNALFDTVIHESVRLREAAAFGLPVQLLDPDCRAVRDFEALAGEVRALAGHRTGDGIVPVPFPGLRADDARKVLSRHVSSTWTD